MWKKRNCVWRNFMDFLPPKKLNWMEEKSFNLLIFNMLDVGWIFFGIGKLNIKFYARYARIWFLILNLLSPKLFFQIKLFSLQAASSWDFLSWGNIEFIPFQIVSLSIDFNRKFLSVCLLLFWYCFSVLQLWSSLVISICFLPYSL